MVCGRLLSGDGIFLGFVRLEVLVAFSFGDGPVRRLLRNLDPIVSSGSSPSGSRFEFEGSTEDSKNVKLSIALHTQHDRPNFTKNDSKTPWSQLSGRGPTYRQGLANHSS